MSRNFYFNRLYRNIFNNNNHHHHNPHHQSPVMSQQPPQQQQRLATVAATPDQQHPQLPFHSSTHERKNGELTGSNNPINSFNILNNK